MGSRILIRNISPETRAWEIEDIFGTVADVASVEIADSQAVVTMVSDETARDCVERFHGYIMGGRALTVQLDQPHVPSEAFLARKRRTLEKKRVGR